MLHKAERKTSEGVANTASGPADPLPASTGIQVRLCRSDLLIEMEAFAIVKGERRG